MAWPVPPCSAPPLVFSLIGPLGDFPLLPVARSVKLTRPRSNRYAGKRRPEEWLSGLHRTENRFERGRLRTVERWSRGKKGKAEKEKMFGKGITLFTLLGFEVKVDFTWIFIAVLITWSLAVQLFPMLAPDLSPTAYWTMGVVGALGLFLSIVLHELGHSLVARKYGIPMKGITLFIFGGVAHMENEPETPKAEFFMAIGGPIVSVFLAILFYAIYAFGNFADWPSSVGAVFGYLGVINGVLVLFNLVPAFPLDGGRVLRSALWAWKKNLKWATRIVVGIGSAFGIVLIALGFFQFLMGNIVGGLWWFLLGLFLRFAANSSYQQLIVRETLRGEKVSSFMNSHPITVAPDTTVEEIIENYVYKHHHKMYPVLDDNSRLTGCVRLQQIKEIPKAERSRRTAGEIATACSDLNTIAKDADASDALARMTQNQLGRLIVIDHDRLAGIISMKDLQRFLSMKMELGPQ